VKYHPRVIFGFPFLSFHFLHFKLCSRKPHNRFLCSLLFVMSISGYCIPVRIKMHKFYVFLILPQPSKGGMNRHFQAKHAKYSNFCIIKTTEVIPAKFCRVIKTTKCGSSQNLPNKSKMAEGRHLEKKINCYISATV